MNSIHPTRARRSGPGPARPVVRRGTVYILVLAISVAVITIAGGSLAVVRAQARAADEQGRAADAQSYAYTALELGRLLIANDVNWRTNRSNGTWISNQTIGGGSFSLDVVNPNGSLNNSNFDPVILTGTGVYGLARHKMQMTLAPVMQPFGCLNAMLFSNQAVTVASATIQGSGTIASNATIAATTSIIKLDVEAVGAISGANYLGKKTTPVPTRSVPDGTVFDYYTANGTAISINLVPAPGGIRTIDRRLFSPSSNPFGAVNSQGIYVINCGGSRILVQNSRIVGTLVLLNVGAGSAMEGAMLCSPVVPNFPSLLVQGAFAITATGTLTESGSPNVNFNPSTAPYRGMSNTNTTDTYATDLQGLFYSSGAMTLGNNPVINGVVVAGGTLAVSSTLVATYSNTFATNPPPGFGLPPQLLPLPGSWVRTVD